MKKIRNIILTFKKNTINFFILLIASLFIYSCANKKDILYLQDFKEEKVKISQDYVNTLQADDILNIHISSPDQQGISPFNLYMRQNPSNAIGGSNQNIMLNYIIRKDGTIQFPILGDVKLSGLTILEAISHLKKEVSKYINNPVVTIEWVNFKFTVSGQVNRPGQYRSQSERVSILDALGMAGDLDIYGQRKNIMLIREINGERHTYFIDLTSKSFMDSEAYFIKQNDVIIVSPNSPQIQASAFNRNIPLYISVTSTIISLIILITR